MYKLKAEADQDRMLQHKPVAHPQPAAKAPEAPKAAQTGKKGGKFVITSSGKKRYLGKSGK